jgi:HJR/Mrr/RecB family endonuclease
VLFKLWQGKTEGARALKTVAAASRRPLLTLEDRKIFSNLVLELKLTAQEKKISSRFCE